MVTFIILTWNRSVLLDRCLSKLFLSLGQASTAEILVMNNGSTDNTRYVADKYPSVKYFELPKNFGLNGYKKIIKKATGDIIVLIDDDVIDFPLNLDIIFTQYLALFPEFGFLSLNVIQNEFTNGAKPPLDYYSAFTKNGKKIEEGPAGGWCAGFRKNDFKKIKLFFSFIPLSLNRCHDGILCLLMKFILKLRSGIISEYYCFHACGPYYSKQFGLLEHDIQKYQNANLDAFVESYKKCL